jgi:hypothetical protein
MHLHPTLAVLAFASLFPWARTSLGDVQEAQDESNGYFPSPEAVMGDLPCVRGKTCRVERIRNVSTHPGMKVVETIRIRESPTAYLTIPDAGLECFRQDHWLIRGNGLSPVLLVSDCLQQDRPGQPGASATEIAGDDLLFRYFDAGESSCLIREVGIHLHTLQIFKEIESDGVLVPRRHGYAINPASSRAIRLPLGRGVEGSPLVFIDGPATLDKETRLASVVTSTVASTPAVGEPPCVGAGTCRIKRTWDVPKCAGMKVVDTRFTMGPFQPDGDFECLERAYWLVRGADAPPVLLAEDCEDQTSSATTGTSTIQIDRCNILFKYMEYTYDHGCLLRDVGIDLRSLLVFKEAERDGTVRNGGCRSRTSRRRTIRLPRGKGDSESPLVEIDGPNLLDTR